MSGPCSYLMVALSSLFPFSRSLMSRTVAFHQYGCLELMIQSISITSEAEGIEGDIDKVNSNVRRWSVK